MSAISANTKVYLWTYHPPHSGQRAWVAEANAVRNNLGNLILKPELDDDPHQAVSFTYALGLVAKRRFETEGYFSPDYHFRFSLSPTGEEVGAGNVASAPTDDNRVIMYYRGLVARPGIDVNHGRVWFVKFPGQSIESVRSDSVEDAVNKVYERNMQHLAEQAPPEPEPEPEPQSKQTPTYRVRPGSLRG